MNLGFYDSFGQGKPCAEEDPKGGTEQKKMVLDLGIAIWSY